MTNNGQPSRFPKGRIDDLRVYEGMLNTGEVMAIVTGQPTPSVVSPVHRSTQVALDTSLIWDVLGANDPTCDVYFGNDPNSMTKVVSATTENSFSPSLQVGTKYYWRVDVTDQSVTYPGGIWEFTTAGLASNPIPASGLVGANPSSVDLSWEGDSMAVSYDVYLGSSEVAVGNANRGSNEYKGPTTDPEYFITSILNQNSTYYWRVDEVDVSGSAITAGDIWSFTTGQLLAHWKFDETSGTNVIDSAGDYDGILRGNENWSTDGVFGGALVFDGSTGIDIDHDLGTQSSFTISFWFKSQTEVGGLQAVLASDSWFGGAMHYNFSGTSIGLWNGAEVGTNFAGPLMDNRLYNLILVYDGIKDQIRYYVDGVESYNNDFGSLTPIDMSDFNIGSWNVSRYFEGILDDVRIYSYAFTVEDAVAIYGDSPFAYLPDPQDGSEDVATDVILSWEAGHGATSHTVNISTEIKDPNSPVVPVSVTVTDTSVALTDLIAEPELETTYYWWVNETTGSGVVQGNVWSFTTVPPGPYGPTPDDGDTGINPSSVDLQWQTSVTDTMFKNKVYFGTNFDLTEDDLQATLDYETMTWNTGELDYSKQYFWKIVNDDLSGITYEGPVWDFNTIVPDCVKPVSDLNGDCKVNMSDFAIMASEWLTCGLIPIDACSDN